MSYQLELQKNPDAVPNIAMPPLPQEQMVQEMADNQGEIAQEMVENQTSNLEQVLEEVVQPVQQKVGPQESFSRLRKERDEALRRLEVYESAQQRFEQPKQQVQQEEPELDINSDDLVEGKHLKQYNKKIQKLEQQLSQYQQQTAASVAEARLKSQYPDFDKVVNKDNIEQLRYEYPELANTLNSSTDLYSTAVSAYTMIKKLGIMPEPVNNYAVEKAQAQKNANKPRPLASVSPQQGDSPLSKANAFANGLTDDLKSQLLKEMYAARRDH